MSQRIADSQTSSLGDTFLADADVFFFYLRGGSYEEEAADVIGEATSGRVTLKVSSEVYDDIISALRADENSLEVARGFIADMKSIPHAALPMSAEVAEEALSLYIEHGGRRKLSYFDSLHVASAKRFQLPFLTSDRWIINNKKRLDLDVVDLSMWSSRSTLDA